MWNFVNSSVKSFITYIRYLLSFVLRHRRHISPSKNLTLASVLAQVVSFVPVKPFQPSLIFVCKARAYLSGANIAVHIVDSQSNLQIIHHDVSVRVEHSCSINWLFCQCRRRKVLKYLTPGCWQRRWRKRPLVINALQTVDWIQTAAGVVDPAH